MHIKLPFYRRAAAGSGRRPGRGARLTGAWTTARLTAALAGLTIPALLGGAVLAGPASASTAFTIHVSPNNTFSLMLDVSGASTQPGAPVIDWWANGGTNQEWTFWPIGGHNTYEIINVNSGLCLTTDGVAGDQLYQLQCAGSPLQLWVTGLNTTEVGSWAIQNYYSRLFVDVSGDSPWPGAAIDTWPYNGQSNQYFVAL